MRIVTRYDPAPIPDRQFDWAAVNADNYDADPESGSIVGMGPTEAEAIADLEEQLEPELICAHCRKPWGQHAAHGEWCLLDQTSGPIFSRTHRFEAFA